MQFPSVFLQSRDIDRRDKAKVRDANMYFFIESAIALLLSLFINVVVMSVFAHGLYGQKNADIVRMRIKSLQKISILLTI